MEIMDGFYQAVSDPVPHLVLENSTETQVKSIRDKIAFIDSQTKVVPFDSIVDVPP